MPITKLRKFLDQNKVKYTIISHSEAYSAQEVAAVVAFLASDEAAYVSGQIIGVNGAMV